jgi:hypothetical protein
MPDVAKFVPLEAKRAHDKERRKKMAQGGLSEATPVDTAGKTATKPKLEAVPRPSFDNKKVDAAPRTAEDTFKFKKGEDPFSKPATAEENAAADAALAQMEETSPSSFQNDVTGVKDGEVKKNVAEALKTEAEKPVDVAHLEFASAPTQELSAVGAVDHMAQTQELPVVTEKDLSLHSNETQELPAVVDHNAKTQELRPVTEKDLSLHAKQTQELPTVVDPSAKTQELKVVKSKKKAEVPALNLPDTVTKREEVTIGETQPYSILPEGEKAAGVKIDMKDAGFTAADVNKQMKEMASDKMNSNLIKGTNIAPFSPDMVNAAIAKQNKEKLAKEEADDAVSARIHAELSQKAGKEGDVKNVVGVNSEKEAVATFGPAEVNAAIAAQKRQEKNPIRKQSEVASDPETAKMIAEANLAAEAEKKGTGKARQEVPLNEVADLNLPDSKEEADAAIVDKKKQEETPTRKQLEVGAEPISSLEKSDAELELERMDEEDALAEQRELVEPENKKKIKETYVKLFGKRSGIIPKIMSNPDGTKDLQRQLSDNIEKMVLDTAKLDVSGSDTSQSDKEEILNVLQKWMDAGYGKKKNTPDQEKAA